MLRACRAGPRRFLGLAALLFSVAMLFSIHASAYTIYGGYKRGDVNILDAYYTDTDGDGREDDVESHIVIDFDGVPYGWLYEYTFYAFLTLPSGQWYGYQIDVITNMLSVDFELVFLNHATESGDYLLEILLVHTFSGYWVEQIYTQLIFDPPVEGQGDAPPSFNVFAS